MTPDSRSTKHTPGPWRATNDVQRDNSIPVAADGQQRNSLHVAHCMEMMHVNEREANARLIAAAPDLLAALRGLLAHDRELCPFGVALNRADGADPGCECNYHAARRDARAAIAKAEGGQS